MRISTRPLSRALLMMLCDSGPSNMPGKAVMMSKSIKFQEAVRRVDRDAAGGHVNGRADGSRGRQQDLVLHGRPEVSPRLDREQGCAARLHDAAHCADLAAPARPDGQADPLKNIVAALREINQPVAGYQDILSGDLRGRGRRIDSPEFQDDFIPVDRVLLDRKTPQDASRPPDEHPVATLQLVDAARDQPGRQATSRPPQLET